MQISSDPEIGDILADGPVDPPIEPAGPVLRLWSVVDGPVGGNPSARASRGVSAANDLRRWPASLGPDRASMPDPLWIHFKMPVPTEVDRIDRCPGADAIDPMPNWVLSRQSIEAIRGMLTCFPDNREAMETLVEALVPATVRPGGAPVPATAMN